MEIKVLPCELSVCKARSLMHIDLDEELFFIGKTDEEISVVCRTEFVPTDATDRDDGWKAFRIQGMLDFTLTGILAKIAEILAEEKISIFAISTFNTDYVLVRDENLDRALKALSDNGYDIV
ncbi:MAG: ACT domain-containing protein [Oscillospiraceae bacterium]|nr:ACT domain-containing protein [Oscillospiraceae bacterium]